MRVIVNDEYKQLPDGATVASMLEVLKLPAKRVAVERNKQLVRRVDRAATALEDGDVLEIVTLVGGG